MTEKHIIISKRISERQDVLKTIFQVFFLSPNKNLKRRTVVPFT